MTHNRGFIGLMLLLLYLKEGNCQATNVPTCEATDPREMEFYPHNCLCTQYYECINGEAIERSCPRGLYWNNKYQICELPSNSACSDVDCSKATSENGLFPSPTNCNFYVQCGNGLLYCMPCSVGLHFSVKTNTCESPADAGCTVEDDLFESVCY